MTKGDSLNLGRAVCVVFLLACSTFVAQPVVDSLKNALKLAAHDSVRCRILNRLIDLEENDAVWATYNEELRRISENNLKTAPRESEYQKVFLNYYAQSLNNEGVLAKQKGDIATAIDCYEKSLAIHQRLNYKEGIAYAYYNISVIYQQQGNISKALSYYEKSLKILQQTNDKAGIAQAMNNIGRIYASQDDTAKALEYYTSSLQINQRIENKRGVATAYTGIAGIYRLRKDLETSLDYSEKALRIYEELNEKNGIAISLNNIGVLYKNLGDPESALEYYLKSLALREELKDLGGLSYTLNNMSSIYYSMKDYDRSLSCALKSLRYAREVGFPEHIRNASMQLMRIYQDKEDFKNALTYYELCVRMRDSIANQETKKAALKSQMKFEYERKAAADSVKNAELKKVKNARLLEQNARIEKGKMQTWFVGGGLAFVAAALLVAFNRYHVIRKRKRIIEDQKGKVEYAYQELGEKNKELLDSIHYARRIQNALLTQESYFTKHLTRLKKF